MESIASSLKTNPERSPSNFLAPALSIFGPAVPDPGYTHCLCHGVFGFRLASRSWLLMDRASFTIAEMVVKMSVCPPTPDLLRMAATCIESVFSAMLRKAHEGVEVPGWHVGNVAMHDSQSLTPLLLDWHGNVVGSEFIGKFSTSLQCFVSSLPGLHSWGVEDTINEQPEPIQRHMLAWRGFLGTCGRSLVEFRVHFHSLPAQDQVETGLRPLLTGHAGYFQERASAPVSPTPLPAHRVAPPAAEEASEGDRASSSCGASSAAAASPAALHARGEVPTAVGAEPMSRSASSAPTVFPTAPASGSDGASAATLLSRLVPSGNTTGAPTVVGSSATVVSAGMPQGGAADALPQLWPATPSALTFAPLTAVTWQPVVDVLEAALRTVRLRQQRQCFI